MVLGNNPGNEPSQGNAWAQMHAPSLRALRAGDRILRFALREELYGLQGKDISQKGEDLRYLLETTRRLKIEIPVGELPTDPAAANPREVVSVAYALSRLVFLPRYEVLQLRVRDSRYEVSTGHINHRTFSRATYLNQELRCAEVTFASAPSDMMATAIGNTVLVDSVRIRRDCDSFVPLLSGVQGLSSPLAKQLAVLLRAHKFSADRYYMIAGYQRSKHEYLQYIKDSIFLQSLLGLKRPPISGEEITKLLKPDSALQGLFSASSDPGGPITVAVGKYGAMLGGLLMQLAWDIRSNDLAAAKVSVADFMLQQAMQLQLEGAGDLLGVCHLAARIFMARLKEEFPHVVEVADCSRALLDGYDLESQVLGCFRSLMRMYKADFLTDSERVRCLAEKGGG